MSGADDGPIRVLHVDDDPDLCEIAAIHLERVSEELDVLTATSAREGLDRIENETVDCVVSDHDMPGMDGLDFLRAVREQNEELPFILFTGKGSETIAAEAVSAGVTEYLQKQTGTEQYALLANRIERAVGEQRAKSALEESERMLSTLIANLPGMVYRCRNEVGWPMSFVSEGATELTGYPADAFEEGEDVSFGEDVIHEDDRDAVWDQVQIALSAGEPFEVTYRIVTADGETRWVWERGRCVEREGDVDILEGFITDITARKTREQELEAEREFTQNVVDALEDVFFVVEPDGSVIRWNDRANEVLGYTDEEIAGKTVLDAVPEEYEARLAAAYEETMDAGVATVEAELETKGGERIPFEFRTTRFHGPHGELVGVCGVGRDVSERRERERELERYRTLVENVGDPMYVLDAEGSVELVNRAMAEHVGYEPGEMIGMAPTEFTREEDAERAEELIAELLADDDHTWASFEMCIVHADGSETRCEDMIAVITDDDGTFQGTTGVIRDIAERKERERRLEEFASVVSHDLRSPLNVVQGRVELAREAVGREESEHVDSGSENAGQDSSDPDEHLAAIERAADRMERLIADLLTLARQGQGVGETEHVDLATLARGSWDAMDANGATLAVDAPGTVEADPERLRGVFENLFRNAIEHASANGSVTVRVGVTPEGFFVADDGPGIPPDRREDVFDRGFTTSEQGTGFGLAIVADIVDAHGWEIAVTEGNEGGARFEVET